MEQVKIEVYLRSKKSTIYPDGSYKSEYYVYMKHPRFPRLFMFRTKIFPTECTQEYFRKILKDILNTIGDGGIFINRFSTLEDRKLKYYLTDGLVLFCFLFKPKLVSMHEKNEDMWECGSDLWDDYYREDFEEKNFVDRFRSPNISSKPCLEFYFTEEDSK